MAIVATKNLESLGVPGWAVQKQVFSILWDFADRTDRTYVKQVFRENRGFTCAYLVDGYRVFAV